MVETDYCSFDTRASNNLKNHIINPSISTFNIIVVFERQWSMSNIKSGDANSSQKIHVRK